MGPAVGTEAAVSFDDAEMTAHLHWLNSTHVDVAATSDGVICRSRYATITAPCTSPAAPRNNSGSPGLAGAGAAADDGSGGDADGVVVASVTVAALTLFLLTFLAARKCAPHGMDTDPPQLRHKVFGADACVDFNAVLAQLAESDRMWAAFLEPAVAPAGHLAVVDVGVAGGKLARGCAVPVEADVERPTAPRVPLEILGGALRVLKRLGGGNYGDVHEALLDEALGDGVTHTRHVAVKTPKTDAGGERSHNAEDLAAEAALMAQFDHPNVVALIGVVSRNAELKVVMQLCDKGSLLVLLRAGYLSNSPPQPTPGAPERSALKIAADVVAAMTYLESRRFVHRDLAARNVMVSADDTCLVGDFGLSRSIETDATYYKVREGISIPIRWCAPEVVVDSRYTTASDVWSFFVLMWEVWSHGERPFGTKSPALVVMLLEEVSNGQVKPHDILRKPEHVDGAVYDGLQQLCWVGDPSGRATFSQLRTWIHDLRGAQPASTLAGLHQTPPAACFDTMTAFMASHREGKGATAGQLSNRTTINCKWRVFLNCSASPRVRPMGRTCSEANKIAK